MLAGAHGVFGFIALDLSNFEFQVAKKTTNSDGETQDQVMTRQISYPSIESALSASWDLLAKSKARVPRLYCALQLIVDEVRSAGRVDPENVEKARVSKLICAKLSEGFLREAVSGEYVRQVVESCRVELPPVCAILGGMLGSEVIKILGGKEAPLDNTFFFDATTRTDGAGVSGRYGPDTLA